MTADDDTLDDAAGAACGCTAPPGPGSPDPADNARTEIPAAATANRTGTTVRLVEASRGRR